MAHYRVRSPNSPSKARTMDRTARAIDLRMQGYNFREIAERIGCAKSEAHRVVKMHLERLAEDNAAATESLRELEAARLDAKYRKLWSIAMDGIDPSVTKRHRRALARWEADRAHAAANGEEFRRARPKRGRELVAMEVRVRAFGHLLTITRERAKLFGLYRQADDAGAGPLWAKEMERRFEAEIVRVYGAGPVIEIGGDHGDGSGRLRDDGEAGGLPARPAPQLPQGRDRPPGTPVGR